MRRNRILVAISGLASLAAVGALWFFFAPTELGGRVDYAVIYGTSMEPTLHRGDLAVLRSRPSYAVGQVVGYENVDLHRVVLHRIVGREGGRLLFKGDNNGFVDSARPSTGQVVGRLWLRVPAIGGGLLWLRTPRHAVVVGVLVALLLAGGGAGAGAGVRRRRPGRVDEDTAGAAPPARRTAADAARPIAAAGATGAVVFAFVALLGFTHSQTRAVTENGAYLQRASFGYFAAAPVGAVYPDGRVRTGDTVFTQLVHRLTVSADYRFSSSLPHAVDGTASFVARLQSQQGFSRELPLAPRTSFSGDRWRAAGRLDLAGLRKDIAAYERSTGVLGDSYTIDVVARFTLRGVVGGRRVETTFAPSPVGFGLDTTKLRLLVPQQAGAPGTTPPDPLHVRAAGALTGTVPASIALGRLHVSVPTAREVGVIGALVSIIVGLCGLLLLGGGRGGDELAQIRRRYDGWLVDVASPLTGTRIVELTTMESLGRLAEYYSRAILHHAEAGAHTFAIEREGTLYRYRVGGEVRRLEAVEPDRPTLALRRDSR